PPSAPALLMRPSPPPAASLCSSAAAPRALHSFPTRRSSDLADVPSAQMSYANTLFSTATQLAVGLGITLGAIGIRIGEKVSEARSEEHTSELQSRENLVCRLLLEKKKKSFANR